MGKYTPDLEKLAKGIKLDTVVDGSMVTVTAADGTYATALEEHVGIDKDTLSKMDTFNAAYARTAVSNLADTLKTTYNGNKKVTEFKANIDFIGSPIVAQGERIISGEIAGKPWESTGLTVKHSGYQIKGLKSIKNDLYAAITK